jgi:hypothetical protein
MIETEAMRSGRYLWNCAHARVGPLVAWGVWAAMTIGMIVFIRQHNRNVPYMDDFALVSVMTGHEPVSLRWVWAQHNEHRPVISRLILAGLSRIVMNDFRTGKYFNVGLLSSAAASMVFLARRLRGSNRVVDAVLPLSILNIGQTESLMITFAMNLILTSWISFALIATVMANRRSEWSTILRFGVLIILLPLCGGSGMVMIPPLVFWLTGFVAWGWWSGRKPCGKGRAIGVGLLLTCSAIILLYFCNYVKPIQHPPAPSLTAAASTTLEYLSTAICPNVPGYWQAGSILLVLLVVTTLVRLTIVGFLAPNERLRAFGLIAIILAMLATAIAIGMSRSGLGPGTALASRYITLTAPLLGALYIAWLVYGDRPARSAVHAILLAIACLVAPANIAFGLQYGRRVSAAEHRVERALRAGAPSAQVMRRTCPAIFTDPKIAYECFQMLKAGGFGEFKSFNDDRVAAAPDPPPTVRR